MSALVTRELCVKAWEVVQPLIASAHAEGVINKRAGTIVVLDPTLDYAPSLRISSVAIFMDHVDQTYMDWQKYREIAEAKAMLSFRTGLSSRDVQQLAPHLYKEPINDEKGDVKWGGSVVRDGLVVAFSGVQAEYDEWISGVMADLLIAMCRRQMTAPDGYMAADSSFIDAGRHHPLPHVVR